MKRLAGISDITGLPIVLALQESCGEDSCADACAQYGDDGCAGCPVQEGVTRLHQYEDTGLLPDEIAQLQAQLTKSQRREQAAVEDFKSVARTSSGLCEFCGTTDCIYAGQSIPYDDPAYTDQCGCFRWRGPGEAGG